MALATPLFWPYEPSKWIVPPSVTSLITPETDRRKRTLFAGTLAVKPPTIGISWVTVPPTALTIRSAMPVVGATDRTRTLTGWPEGLAAGRVSTGEPAV